MGSFETQKAAKGALFPQNNENLFQSLFNGISIATIFLRNKSATQGGVPQMINKKKQEHSS